MRYDCLDADEVLAKFGTVAIRVDRPAPRVEIRAWADMIWARGAAALAQVTPDLLGGNPPLAA